MKIDLSISFKKHQDLQNKTKNRNDITENRNTSRKSIVEKRHKIILRVKLWQCSLSRGNQEKRINSCQSGYCGDSSPSRHKQGLHFFILWNRTWPCTLLWTMSLQWSMGCPCAIMMVHIHLSELLSWHMTEHCSGKSPRLESRFVRLILNLNVLSPRWWKFFLA